MVALFAACHHTHTMSANALSATYGRDPDKSIFSADVRRASAAALVEQARPGDGPSESAAPTHWMHQPTQQADMPMPMPHRNRDPVRSALRKLFGRHKPTAVSSDTMQSLHEQVSHKPSAERHVYCCGSFVRHSGV